MRSGMLRWIFLLFVAVFLLVAQPAISGEKPAKIRFGTLPVLQALPVYVAQDKGIFGRVGLDVELVPFNTAAEKDIALAAGSIDGYFGDLLTPIVLKGNGRDVFMVAANYDTRFDRRMFAVLGKPGGPYKAISDLASAPIGISSNTVIDYVTERLLTSGGVTPDKFVFVETKNIGMRMQMLLSGQVEAATLPEPLVTAAMGKKAVVLADDAGMATSQTVLIFSGSFLRQHAQAVRVFLKAQQEAAALINTQPDAVRPIMVEHVRLPEPLKAVYPVPRFPEPRAPDKEAVATIGAWLVKRGVIQAAPTYEQVVDAQFIP
jgi:NitT/TauT family transport system substrate-binding protein